ncbi:MAG TPA: hypothetical protein PLU91_13730 [Verrucomicrobiota bacterium]|jgi:hypothetical protein|nr:hypothetical protein [Verrucomicrobiota bacterium]
MAKAGKMALETETHFQRVVLHSPDLSNARLGTPSGNTWRLDPSGISRYFVVECSA